MNDSNKKSNKPFTDEQLQVSLLGYQGKAEDVLKSEDKMEKLFRDLERKLKVVPIVGTKLSTIPQLASLLHSYWKKEYTAVPFGTILAIAMALLYFVSPIDLIPDSIPGIGYLDDAAVIGMCWNWVEDDVKQYNEWRSKNKTTD